MEKILLELATQSRKRKIKDNEFLDFYKPYEKSKTDEDDEDIEYRAILNSNFVSQLVSAKKRKLTLPIEYETRNVGKIATGGGQEKTLKGIYELQEQHLS